MKSGRYGLLDGTRLRDTPAFRRGVSVFAVAACLALPHGIALQALASAAGILFEAAPLLLVAALARRRFGETLFVRRAAGLFGCGCGHTLGPAALSVPATLLCLATFGPAIAGARFLGAAFLAVRRAGARALSDHESDPLAELEAIVGPSLLLGAATALFAAGGPRLGAGLLPPFALVAIECGAGIIAGSLAPCATAAVALAAMVRTTAPDAAIAILATAGLTPSLGNRMRDAHEPHNDARLALASIGVACAILAMRGSSGLVHPRLVPLVALGSVCALIATVAGRPRTASRHRLLPAATMFAVLVLGSPAPTPATVSGRWDGVYPGEAVTFTGVAQRENGRLQLVRYSITCCRADASAIVVPIDAPRADIRAGAWVIARGTVRTNGSELYLHAESIANVAAPSDIYTYR